MRDKLRSTVSRGNHWKAGDLMSVRRALALEAGGVAGGAASVVEEGAAFRLWSGTHVRRGLGKGAQRLVYHRGCTATSISYSVNQCHLV
jgi:hypothetical protein